MPFYAGASLFCIGCPSILVPLFLYDSRGTGGTKLIRQIVILCNYGAIRAVISHRVKNHYRYERINQYPRAPVARNHHPRRPVRQSLPPVFSRSPCLVLGPVTEQAFNRH